MRTDRITEPPPQFWDDANFETKLEADLARSVQAARSDSLPQELKQPVQPVPITRNSKLEDCSDHKGSTELSQLVGGAGIAAIDGYLHFREYAASKNLHLSEMKANGVDLQDLISTLIIGHQQRNNGNQTRRFAR